MRLVIDEWLWADLGGANKTERQRESFLFLQKVFERCDQLVTAAEGRFLKKFWYLAENARAGALRKIVKVFKAQFFLNSEKLGQCKEDDLQLLPDGIRGGVKEDDQYLVRVYLTYGADVLVTTDNPLIEAVKNHSIHCRTRDEFLREYMSRQGLE